MISIWEQGIDERKIKYLKKDQSCQVLILGGNLAGLLCAIFYQKQGYDVIVVEEETLEKRALELSFFDGSCDLKTWAYSNWYVYLIQKYQWRCSMQKLDSYAYWLKEKSTEKQMQQIVFHPIRLLREIGKEIRLYEETEVVMWKEKKAYSNLAIISFEHMIDLRKKRLGKKETWVAFENMDLEKGIYICMDGGMDIVSYQNWMIVKAEYERLFPKSHKIGQWNIDIGRKIGIYESMEQVFLMIKKF